MRRRHTVVFILALALGLSTGCKSSKSFRGRPSASAVPTSPSARMLVWTGSMQLSVSEIPTAEAAIHELVSKAGGFVEEQSDYEGKRLSLTLRLPSAALERSMNEIAELGSVTSRSISSKDVTEEHIDVAARLENLALLRDRLKALLERAQAVTEILAIETELSRVQSEIDSLAGRKKALEGQVDYATLHIRLTRERIPGPLGIIGKAVDWTIGKLFIIRA